MTINEVIVVLRWRVQYMRKTRNQGFTIVELLIVIVVIAILAAITVVAYRGITASADDSVTQSDLDQFTKKTMLLAVDDWSEVAGVDEYDTGPFTLWLNNTLKPSQSSKERFNMAIIDVGEWDSSNTDWVYVPAYKFVARSNSGKVFTSTTAGNKAEEDLGWDDAIASAEEDLRYYRERLQICIDDAECDYAQWYRDEIAYSEERLRVAQDGAARGLSLWDISEVYESDDGESGTLYASHFRTPAFSFPAGCINSLHVFDQTVKRWRPMHVTQAC